MEFRPRVPQPTKFNIEVQAGWIRFGTLMSIDQNTMTAKVRINQSQIENADVIAQLPLSFVSSSGAFIGGYVSKGTPVLLCEAESSGAFYIVSFLARDSAAQNTIGINSLEIPTLKEGDVVIQSNPNSSISLFNDGILLGEYDNALELDTARNILVNTFDSNYTLSQATRQITGIIKRDKKPSIKFASYLRLNDSTYDDTLITIGMDPTAPISNSNAGSSIRNPARVEQRTVVLEYEDSANIQANDIEIKNYNSNSAPVQIDYGFINRRQGRADTLSLSSVAPNYLIETISGNVVDIFGNLLDINRNIIPIGQDIPSAAKIKTTLDASDTFSNAYQQLKREERRSIAFHFELNARKEEGIAASIDVSKSASETGDYGRPRSRFSLDIDKEGQLKLNIPASSEYGNVSLQTRYENYSTVNPDPKTKDPNTLVFDSTTGVGNSVSRDIVIDSFINSPGITLVDNLKTNASPLDRFTQNYIKHGTVYHDITKTCISMQSPAYEPPEYIKISEIALGQIDALNPVVSSEIQVSGKGANAGGRSASVNLDGSLEVNIGANTVDRQSLWMDLQGGMVWNVGKDLPNGASLVASMDGKVFMEIGGRAAPQDKRFVGQIGNAASAGVLDIRVANGNGEFAILRMDEAGLTITTPSRITMVSNGDMTFFANGTMTLDADVVNIQGRNVVKDGSAVGGTI